MFSMVLVGSGSGSATLRMRYPDSTGTGNKYLFCKVHRLGFLLGNQPIPKEQAGCLLRTGISLPSYGTLFTAFHLFIYYWSRFSRISVLRYRYQNRCKIGILFLKIGHDGLKKNIF